MVARRYNKISVCAKYLTLSSVHLLPGLWLLHLQWFGREMIISFMTQNRKELRKQKPRKEAKNSLCFVGPPRISRRKKSKEHPVFEMAFSYRWQLVDIRFWCTSMLIQGNYSSVLSRSSAPLNNPRSAAPSSSIRQQ